MSNTNQIENTNSESSRRPTMQEVDDLAAEICKQFSNYKYFPWYCKAIWTLGIPRVRELMGRVEGVRVPGRLFTKYIKEDLNRINGRERLDSEWKHTLDDKNGSEKS